MQNDAKCNAINVLTFERKMCLFEENWKYNAIVGRFSKVKSFDIKKW